MKETNVTAMKKYLKFQYWTRYLRDQQFLTEQEYCQMLRLAKDRILSKRQT